MRFLNDIRPWPQDAIALLATLQSADIVLSTTDPREIRLRRITEPTAIRTRIRNAGEDPVAYLYCVRFYCGHAAEIPTGAHVFLEGELIYREYERTIETESVR